jgi:hypothetical protein
VSTSSSTSTCHPTRPHICIASDAPAASAHAGSRSRSVVPRRWWGCRRYWRRRTAPPRSFRVRYSCVDPAFYGPLHGLGADPADTIPQELYGGGQEDKRLRDALPQGAPVARPRPEPRKKKRRTVRKSWWDAEQENGDGEGEEGGQGEGEGDAEGAKELAAVHTRARPSPGVGRAPTHAKNQAQQHLDSSAYVPVSIYPSLIPDTMQSHDLSAALRLPHIQAYMHSFMTSLAKINNCR